MSKRRLEAEAVRDAMLAVSGQLDRTQPKGSAVARSGEGNSEALQRAGAFDARLTGPFGLPARAPEQLPRVAGALRLPRPGSDRRGACNDDGTVAGVVPAEQSVRDAPGRDGRHPAPLGFRRRLRLPADPREPTCASSIVRQRRRSRPRSRRSSPPTDADRPPPSAHPAGPTDPGAVWAAIYQALFASAEFLYRG